MSNSKNIFAIGRSRYLYDGIRHVVANGYTVKAIITEEAYEEYDIKHHHFEELAKELGAKFYMMRSMSTDEIKDIIKEHNVRAAISANWKYTIHERVLDLFECGILNFHLGNLPDYKGNATVNWTILNGERYINGNIHKMESELDAGDIIVRKAIPIGQDTYISEILAQAEKDVPDLYLQALNKVWINPEACEVKGSLQGMRCYPRLPEDSQINWNNSAEQIGRLVRASSHPYSGAFCFLNGEKVTIWKAKVFNPEEKFLAIPGHVCEVRKSSQSILVACTDAMLEVQEIGYQGKVMPPTELIKSIRVRFK